VPKVSVTIITLNEADHIADAIASVAWADEIIVVDSGSSDETVAIARQSGARVEHRAWSGWSDQKNHAAALATHDWILSLDADERVTPALAAEIRALLRSDPPLHGYRIPRVAFYLGRWIRTTDFYPDYQTRLYDRRAATWRSMRVHESVRVDGQVGVLRHEIEHYSFRDIGDQLERLHKYSALAALQMHEDGRRAGVFDLLVHPPAAFLRNYLLRRGFLDGTAGLVISLLNAYGVFLKFVRLWELRQREPAPTKARQARQFERR
jgi:glycosyltransferase involved in cell wall biosynthesis